MSSSTTCPACAVCPSSKLNKDVFLLVNPWFRTHNIIKQLLQALEHPSFQKMVSIAAHATHSIKLNSQKQTRNAFMKTFKEQMKGLKECLNVCFEHYLVDLNY